MSKEDPLLGWDSTQLEFLNGSGHQDTPSPTFSSVSYHNYIYVGGALHDSQITGSRACAHD